MRNPRPTRSGMTPWQDLGTTPFKPAPKKQSV